MSKDAGSKDKGGELGWSPADALCAGIQRRADQVFTLGKVTDAPVKTQFGWHIIQLVDARNAQGPSFDELWAAAVQRIQGARN